MTLDVLAASRAVRDDAHAPAGSLWVGREGARVRYLRAGGGEAPPVVLIHGACSTADDVAGALFPLLAEGRTVYALDRPGHGWSDRARWLHASAQAQGAALLQAIEALGIERPILVGHSFGGACAMAMALAAPETVRGVVAVSPVAFPEPRLEQVLFNGRSAVGTGDLYARTAGRLTSPPIMQMLWEAMFTPHAMPPAFREVFPFHRARGPAQMVATGEDAAAMPLSLAENVAGYGRCRVPVRVLVGTGDIVASNMHGRVLAASVPDGRLERLPGQGHMMHWFAPEAVRAQVEDLSSTTAI